MNRPPTPAGPLFSSRRVQTTTETTPANETSLKHPKDPSQYSAAKLGFGIQHASGNVTYSGMFDLQNQQAIYRNRIRRPLRDITNSLDTGGSTSVMNLTVIKTKNPQKDTAPRNGKSKATLPLLNQNEDRTFSAKGILRSGTEIVSAPLEKQASIISPGIYHRKPPVTNQSKKTVKFRTTENVVPQSTPSSDQTEKKRIHSNGYEVKGSAMNKEPRQPEIQASRRIRIIRRPQDNTSSALSMFRRKLQQNLELKYSPENTVLQPDCVIRREDTGVRSVTQQQNPRTILGRRIQEPSKVSRQQASVTKSSGPLQDEEDLQEKRKNDVKSDNYFSYKLAEKAEEYFTRNLRHLQGGAPQPKVVKTYVVEEDPTQMLNKMADKTAPLSLTTKNLEIHNSWWTSLDTKESYNQKVNAREKRIRRWIEEMQSTSRMGQMRVVNVVVKDKGLLVKNSRDDIFDRLSQVPSQVMG